MADSQARCSSFEKRVSSIIGRQLAGVRYFDVEIGTKRGRWYSPPPGHRLDFGLDLRMADGSIVGLTWGSEFSAYNVAASIGSLGDKLLAFTDHDVTEAPEWRPYLGKRIESTKVFWSSWDPGNRYPQEVALRFESLDPVYVCVSEHFADRDQLLPGTDNILVVFSDENARRYAIGPYAVDANSG